MPTDEQIVESSTTPALPDIATLSPAELTEWRKNGTPFLLPKEESAPSKPSAPEKVEPAAVTEPASTQGKKKGAEDRIIELLEERHELRKRLEALEQAGQKTEESATSEETKPAERPKRPVRPTFGAVEGQTWNQFEEALAKYDNEELPAYEDALSEWLIGQTEAKLGQKAQAEAFQKSWDSQVEEGRKAHTDFDTVAYSKDTPISDVMDQYIRNSGVGPQILYLLGKDGSAEGKRIAALDPIPALEAMVQLKLSLSEEKKAPVKATTTKASRPVTDLAARNGAPVDLKRAAIEAGNFTEYKRLADAEERAERGLVRR